MSEVEALGSNLVIEEPGKIETRAPIGMPQSKWILLEENDDIPPTGLFVGHNGTGYIIQTGVPVQVPVHILEILDNAIMSAPVLDPNTKRVAGWRERRRYNYRFVEAPLLEE